MPPSPPLPSLELDPCERARALRGVQDAIATGRMVQATRFGEDFVQFAKADPGAIAQMVKDADAACALRLNLPTKRKRFARGVSFKPY